MGCNVVNDISIDRILVPLDFISAKRVQVGDTLDVSVNFNGCGKAVKRVYRVMTVDRVNEIASCVLIREFEIRV